MKKEIYAKTSFELIKQHLHSSVDQKLFERPEVDLRLGGGFDSRTKECTHSILPVFSNVSCLFVMFQARFFCIDSNVCVKEIER